MNETFHLHEVDAENDLLLRDRTGDWLDAVEAGWRAGVRHLTFMTSGTTSAPKRCTHALDHLDVEATFLATRFAGRRRIVALAPAHHVYGFLFAGLLADQLGAEVWVAHHASASDLVRGLRADDLIVSFPERWGWIERSLPAIPAGVVGVVSTAPCPAALSEALVGKGLSEMVEVYGSTETAGIALRTSSSDPYQLMPHWTLEPARGEDEPAWLRHVSGRRAILPDRIRATGLGRFELRGRVDGAVQVGGVNVHPASIADRLRGCPSVLDVVVRLMRTDEGNRLKAFVVPARDADEDGLEAALSLWSDRNLTTAERPRSFTFGPHLPTSALGKSADW